MGTGLSGEGEAAGRTELNEYALTATAGEFSIRDEYTDTDIMDEETSGSTRLLCIVFVCTPLFVYEPKCVHAAVCMLVPCPSASSLPICFALPQAS
jgi:hypothetical protein